MTTITQLSDALQKLFSSTAERLAKATGFVKRQRVVSGAGFAQALVFGGLAEPEATRKQVHNSATQTGMRLSVQGLDQRFTPEAVEFMRKLLEEGVTQLVTSEQATVVLPQFNGVYLTDCTQVAWPGFGMKMAVRLELQRGGLQICLTDLNRNDQKTEIIDRVLPPGALHLGDLGFFKLKRFRAWSAANVYWLTRYKIGTNLFTPEGHPIDLKKHLTGSEPIAFPVRMGSGACAVDAFLVAAPLPPDALVKRQARLKEQARLDQHPLSARQIELADWTIYVTNIPNLTFAQAFVLARTRWQIELLFKFWKSHAKILVSRSADPIRQQCEGYAKLLGILVANWLLLVAGWEHDRVSAVDALRILRAHLPMLRYAFWCGQRLTEFFRWLCDDLAAAPRRSPRRKVPLTFQLWYELEDCFP